jgi:CRISPR-associated endonuclease Csn1
MSSYIFGLDIGSNSIGWALVENKPKQCLLAVGARVFPEGVDRDTKGAEISKNQTRRLARGARRNRSRKAYRKDKLVRNLQFKDFLPKQTEALEKLFVLNPYALRAKGLDEQLTRHEFGRVLYHLNQRRGFWSNRKNGKATEDGLVKKQASELQSNIDESNCRTLGEYFYKINNDATKIRGHYTFRSMYEKEFDMLWARQAEYYPELKDEDFRIKICHKTIYYQRPLKPQDDKIRNCELEPNEKCCPRSNYYARRFRLLQDVNHLKIRQPDGNEDNLTLDQKKIVFKILGEKKDVTFDEIRKKLGLMETQTFNLEEGKADKKTAKMKGDEFAASLRNILKKNYSKLNEDDIALLNDYVEDDSLSDGQVEKAIIDKFGFTAEQAGKIKDISLPEKYAAFSKTAIRKLLLCMEKGYITSDAILAVYGERKKDIVITDTLGFPEDTRNPLVNKALWEVRKVVNAIVREYGKPDKIAIEMARDIKGSLEERKELQQKIKDNERENDRAREELLKMEISRPSRDDIIKYKLWQECGQVCPYTGRPISQAALFGSTPDFQIEHILPYSRSLDDSYMNKTLCYVHENRLKGNETPYEYYNGKEQYDQIKQRIRVLPYPKRIRFSQKEVQLDNFIQRQLNDTRYISRQVVAYLKTLGVDVFGTKGQTTAELRHQWGLNNILDLTGSGLKNRDDHRHHAIDAIVIALTTRDHLTKLATSKYNKTKEVFDEPWDGFRKEAEEKVNQILVSHRSTRKVSGALHEETNYGPTGLKDDKGQDVYVYRKKIEDLTGSMVSKIVDPVVQKIIRDRLWSFGIDPEKNSGKVGKEVWKEPLYMKAKNGGGPQIKSVRIRDVFNNMIGLKNPHGKIYRAVSSGSNHHIEIFEYKDGKNSLKRDARVVTMYEATQRIRSGKPVVCRESKDGNTFMFSLAKNDLFLMKINDSEEKLHRIQKFGLVGGSVVIIMRPHTYAGQLSDSDKPPLIQRKSPNTLVGYKVQIDPLGRITRAND